MCGWSLFIAPFGEGLIYDTNDLKLLQQEEEEKKVKLTSQTDAQHMRPRPKAHEK